MIDEEFTSPLNQMQAKITTLLDKWVGTPMEDIKNNIKNIWGQYKAYTSVSQAIGIRRDLEKIILPVYPICVFVCDNE